jgi:hypothetical protein
MRTRTITAAAIAVACSAPAAASAASPSFATTEACDEHQAFVAGDDRGVAAQLPKRYTPVREPEQGRPVLFARAIRCRALTIGDRSRPVTMASYGIVVESPDGRGCASGAPAFGNVKGDDPPICNWYTKAWLADDRGVVDWLRAGGSGFPAAHVRDLGFQLAEFDAAQGGAPFRFRSPSFTIDAVGRERPGELSVRGGYWADTQQGQLKVAFSTETLVSGDATGTVAAAPGSPLAKLMGTTRASYLPGYTAFSAERWERAVYRRQNLSPAANTDSFAGSCATQGTVTFDPPARNEARPGSYAYDARGTCTGTVNGRRVTDAPVRLAQAGRAHVSCLRAHTTTPGQGTLTFADGSAVRYTLDFTTAATEVDATFYGERSGTATVHGTFATDRTPKDVTAQCAGEGARTVPLDLEITTHTPLVSNRPGAAGTPGREGDGPGSDARARPRLRLSVTPRRVRAGRRTAFVFRVRTAARRPVRGAVVRFAGRRVRTRRNGRARIALTPRRTGRRAVRAAKRGFRGARATVVVRRR